MRATCVQQGLLTSDWLNAQYPIDLMLRNSVFNEQSGLVLSSLGRSTLIAFCVRLTELILNSTIMSSARSTRSTKVSKENETPVASTSRDCPSACITDETVDGTAFENAPKKPQATKRMRDDDDHKQATARKRLVYDVETCDAATQTDAVCITPTVQQPQSPAAAAEGTSDSNRLFFFKLTNDTIVNFTM